MEVESEEVEVESEEEVEVVKEEERVRGLFIGEGERADMVGQKELQNLGGFYRKYIPPA